MRRGAPAKRSFSKGQVSPMSLKRRLSRVIRRGVTTDLELAYLGEEMVWPNVTTLIFNARVGALPESEMWQ